MLAAPSAKKGLTGQHVLVMVLGFFGVVFIVNAVFLYEALSSYTGVIAQEPYRKGLKYNERIAADERQGALAWSVELGIEPSGRLALSLVEAGGQPVSGLTVSGVIGRASTAQQDMALTFTETRPGAYHAAVGTLAPGSWLASLEIRGTTAAASSESESDIVYRLRRRLWVK
jgi:nitrogen fixation protein FixH